MFVYYNINPDGESTGDCVIRAISLALGMDYYDAIYNLLKSSNYFNCDMLVKECYSNMLDDLGFAKYYGNGRTVKEVAEDFYHDKLLIRIDGHLTCALYGDIYDTWNPSGEIVDIFWVISD